ncbi:MAG: hypothetical protein AAFQ77_03105 [Myxococcota bacterium]
MQSLQSQKPLSALAHSLLQTILEWPAATRRQLSALTPRGWLSIRSVANGLRELRSLDLVQSQRLPEAREHHYVPTRRALTFSPHFAERYSPAITSTAIPSLLRGYHRAQLTLVLEEQGYRVARDNTALDAVHRYLLRNSPESLHEWITESLEISAPDGRLVSSVFRCPRCGKWSLTEFGEHHRPNSQTPCDAKPRRAPLLTYDVASHSDPDRPPLIPLVDNPNASVLAQLTALPVRFQFYDDKQRRIVRQAPIDVCFVPTDDGSIYDASTRDWAERGRGERLRRFDAALLGVSHGSRQGFVYGRNMRSVPIPQGVFFDRIHSIEDDSI